MTQKTTLDTTKLLGFDANGAPLFDVVVPTSALDTAQSNLAGAQKEGVSKIAGFSAAEGMSKTVGTTKLSGDVKA